MPKLLRTAGLMRDHSQSRYRLRLHKYFGLNAFGVSYFLQIGAGRARGDVSGVHATIRIAAIPPIYVRGGLAFDSAFVLLAPSFAMPSTNALASSVSIRIFPKTYSKV
jgi:hypothetical protein